MDDGGEQLPLAHGGQQEGHRVLPLQGQLLGHVGPVDVVHPGPGAAGQIVVQESLEGAHRQLLPGVGHRQLPPAPPAGHIGEHVARPPALDEVGVEVRQGVQQRLRLHPEHHPVDGLELQGVVVEVDQLHQGVSGGQLVPLVRGGELLGPLIALLGGGQGVVAVPHGEQEDGQVLHQVIAVAEGGGVGQGGQSGVHLLLLLSGQPPAPEVPPLLHELEVVQGLHLVGVLRQGLDHRPVRVVGQEHHVGQLDGGVLPHRHTGRDAGEDGPLGGPDGGAGAGLVVVLLQVHHADEPPAHRPAVQGALHIEEAVRVLLEAALPEIAAHGGVDLHDVGLHVGALQAALRQDQPQGGGGPAHPLLHPLPVLRLGGVLVTGHHAPQAQVAVPGEQDVRRAER